MTLVRLTLLFAALTAFAFPAFAEWQLVEEPERSLSPERPGLFFAKRVMRRVGDDKLATVHLAFFNSADYRLEVIDLGAEGSPAYPTVRDAFQAHHCMAGVNGGFFRPGFQPIGLVVAQGRRINRLETAKLLSGVIFADDKGIHLVRRGAFVDHPGISALLQTGPYLVEHGAPVRGLSPNDPDRRTFIATDWRRNWAIGTCSALTLEELADLLAFSALTGWKIDRAINLDGGTSTAFYFDRPGQDPDVVVTNWKRVANVLGIASKR